MKKIVKIKESKLVDMLDNIVAEAVAKEKTKWVSEQLKNGKPLTEGEVKKYLKQIVKEERSLNELSPELKQRAYNKNLAIASDKKSSSIQSSKANLRDLEQLSPKTNNIINSMVGYIKEKTDVYVDWKQITKTPYSDLAIVFYKRDTPNEYILAIGVKINGEEFVKGPHYESFKNDRQFLMLAQKLINSMKQNDLVKPTQDNEL